MKKGRALLKYALHLAVLVGVVWAAVKTIDGEQFREAIVEFNWIAAPIVCLLGVGSLFIKAWRFATLVQEVKDVPRSVAMKAYIAGQSMTLLPGGIAARAGLMNQVGVKPEKSAPAIALSSISDQLGFALLGAVAALWFEQARKPLFIFLGVLLVVAILLGVEATRTWLSKVVGWLLGKFNLKDKWIKFVSNMKETLDWKVVAVGVVNSLMADALLIAGLGICMWAVGHQIPVVVLILAFAVPTMVGRISAMPGGVGLTEVGMIGVLDRFPDVRLDQAAAAVLVFRLGTVLFTALVGAIMYWTGWRKVAKKGKAAIAA